METNGKPEIDKQQLETAEKSAHPAGGGLQTGALNGSGSPAPVKRKLNKTKVITYSAALSALGMIVVLFMPPIILDPAAIMTVTVGSHVSVFIAMMIHPIVGISTAAVTAFTYLIKPTLPFPGNLAVFFRAISHLAFVIPMSLVAQKWLKPEDRKMPAKMLTGKAMAINGITAVIHMVAEVIAVTAAYLIFTLAINLFTVRIDPFYVFVVVGLITLAHSVVDFIIAFAIYIPLRRARAVHLFE